MQVAEPVLFSEAARTHEGRVALTCGYGFAAVGERQHRSEPVPERPGSVPRVEELRGVLDAVQVEVDGQLTRTVRAAVQLLQVVRAGTVNASKPRFRHQRLCSTRAAGSGNVRVRAVRGRKFML